MARKRFDLFSTLALTCLLGAGMAGNAAANPLTACSYAQLLRTLGRAIESHGLRPDDYALSPQGADSESCDEMPARLARALHDLRAGAGSKYQATSEAQARLHLISRMILTYAQVAPRDAEANIGKLLDTMAPSHPVYSQLRLVYRDYLELADKGGLPRIPDGKSIKPGQDDPRVERLRRYLILTGDYDVKDWTRVSSSATFSEDLQAALKHFQERHGLNPDGTLGKETLAALNTPVSERLTKIAMTMERLRQVQPPSGSEYIHVNLPSFRLTAYEKGKPALQMRVIVGEKRNPTPEFSNQITQLVLNPTWTPTPKILKNEMLPKARSNPASLRGYQVTDRRTGAVLDPMSVDWNSVGLGDVHIQQPAGAGNALGKVKFLMPKSDSIYLHDTARPQLFSQAFRALSHGCIRLEKPKDLAKFVMQLGRPQDAPKLEAAYSASATRTYQMTQPLPVVTTYYTAWVNGKGQPEFYPDIYGRDAQLHARISRRTEKQIASR